jgi:HK97 family phage portal protein
MARVRTEANTTEGALMGLFDTVKGLIDPFRVETRSAAPFTVSYEYPNLQTQISTMTGWRRAHGYGPPTVAEALGVPSILSCVSLIQGTVGQLTAEGWRNGIRMAESPRIISRPDPWYTPRDFYASSGFNMAAYGEAVWCIGSFDGDGLAQSLTVVPLKELKVEENPRDRRLARYIWGDGTPEQIVSTRWSPVNPTGRFVHLKYLPQAGQLRGEGPLQIAGAATSVSVEAQQWAANFYRGGGYPSMNLHSETELEDTEADELANAWANKPSNWPRVTSGDIEAKEFGVNPQGAQMLDARTHQDGESARMFRIPGTLVEYNAAGSSLTYQNIGEVFTFFVKSCLQPLYLEPIENALSDLLPRTTVARFNVDAFNRPDMKSRWEVYDIATRVIGQDEAAQWAREREGLAPGDVEYKPVPFAPPAAIPSRMPLTRVAVELRCDGMMQKRKSGIARLEKCGALLSKDGVFVGRCRRCKKEYAAA